VEGLDEESTKSGTTEPSFARLLPHSSGSSNQAESLAMLNRISLVIQLNSTKRNESEVREERYVGGLHFLQGATYIDI
jgi:hypothetical protein